MSVTVIGKGRLGHLIAEHCFNVHDQISAREFARTPVIKRDVVVYAGGQAGDQACLDDPLLAVTLHVTVVRELVGLLQAGMIGQLTLLGTVAPLIGFYGPLKQMAMDWAWMACQNESLTILELGQVIGTGIPIDGNNAGAMAHMLRALRDDQPLTIFGTGEQTIRLTPVDSLIEQVDKAALTPVRRRKAPVSMPFQVGILARTARRLCGRDAHPIQTIPVLQQPVSYREPQGEIVPVTPLARTLADWIESLAIKAGAAS